METNITLPNNILPHEGRFGAGPSHMRAEQVQAVSAAQPRLLGTSHRQKPVKNLVSELRVGLKTFFHAPADYEVILGLGGATAFWDAATFGLINKKAQHLSFGEFGAKFAAATRHAPFLDEPTIIAAEAGKLAVPEPRPDVDAYAWPQNETSTGVVAPVQRPQGSADSDALVLVDATSAAAGVDVDITQTDVYYFSPQKNFGSDGGLWVALFSPAALARVQQIKTSGRWIPAFLDLGIAVENSLKNQTYNTPALMTLLTLGNQVSWLNTQGGLSFSTAKTAAMSHHIYSWAEESAFANPFVSTPEYRSPVITTIDFDKAVDAQKISTILRNHGIVDTEPYRKLGRNQLRIASFVNIDLDDIQALTACINYIAERL